MIPFQLFLEDSYLGNGFISTPEAFHYFCRHCGRVWARLVPLHESTHHTVTCNCPLHDDANWSAAVLCDTPRHITIKWPLEALVRDFLYLMERREAAPIIPNNLPHFSEPSP